MPKPIAVCIESLDAEPGARYMRCTALPGGEAGLGLDARGEVLWESEDDIACELWVSADQKLILFRPDGAPASTLHRAGRSLDVPCGKPVVVIDRDEVVVGTRRVRVHVHGEAPTVEAPSVFVPEQRPLGLVGRAAAAIALGSAMATVGCETRDVEVRDHPPRIAPPAAPPEKPKKPEPKQPETTKADVPGGSATKPIEVRRTAPRIAPSPPR